MDGSLPMQGDFEDPFWIEGRPKPVSDNDKPWALWYEVDPNYLKAMGIPLFRGRFFTTADDSHSRGVAVIDSVFAEKYFPDEDPVGKTIVDDYVGPTQVVGVIGHVQHWGPGLDTESKLRAQMYFPFAHIRDKAVPTIAKGFAVVVRTRGDPTGVIGSIRSALARMNSQQVMHDAQTMSEESLRGNGVPLICPKTSHGVDAPPFLPAIARLTLHSFGLLVYRCLSGPRQLYSMGGQLRTTPLSLGS
jgi:MacB-like periplasmic core domain